MGSCGRRSMAGSDRTSRLSKCGGKWRVLSISERLRISRGILVRNGLFEDCNLSVKVAKLILERPRFVVMKKPPLGGHSALGRASRANTPSRLQFANAMATNTASAVFLRSGGAPLRAVR